ncbi:hypothetical protein [Lysinibacillus capsici]|uniref:hypothetical protein n=1 Tax=Lysinibacillus capsici TaxID=2115968 RepID=UPI002FDCF8D1
MKKLIKYGKVVLYSFISLLLVFATLLLTILIIYIVNQSFGDKDTILAGCIGFVGAFLGGVLTLFGVRMTIMKQEEERIKEKIHYREMFYIHLRDMRKALKNAIESFEKGSDESEHWFLVSDFTIVPDWEMRMLYLDHLSFTEKETLSMWMNFFEQQILSTPTTGQLLKSKNKEVPDIDEQTKLINITRIKGIYNKDFNEVEAILNKIINM